MDNSDSPNGHSSSHHADQQTNNNTYSSRRDRSTSPRNYRPSYSPRRRSSSPRGNRNGREDKYREDRYKEERYREDKYSKDDRYNDRSHARGNHRDERTYRDHPSHGSERRGPFRRTKPVDRYANGIIFCSVCYECTSTK